jgi:WD40 repeat protein
MPSEPTVLDAHGRHAQAVHFTRDGKTLVSAGQDARIRLWSVPDFAPAGELSGHAKSVNTLSFSPDEKLLATGASDPAVRLWSFPEGKTLHTLARQVHAVLSPDAARLEPRRCDAPRRQHGRSDPSLRYGKRRSERRAPPAQRRRRLPAPLARW